jgi:putative transposase
MKKHICKLNPRKFYHIYNRGNNGDNLFYFKENYSYFLIKYDEYLFPYIDTFAFSLMPNHFHFLIYVKEDLQVPEDKKHWDTAKIVSHQFQRFFTSYSMSVNRYKYPHHGSLFEKPFRRIEVDNTSYLANLVFYIHANPQLHGITDDFTNYPWSSFQRILKGKPSHLKKEEVLQWFKNPANYLKYHAAKPDIELIKKYIIEY